jgi:large subunit ribosomal protein L32
MRHTKGHTRNRRSHHSRKKTVFSVCEKCGEFKISHRVCAVCGTYSKRPVIDVLKKLTKKEKKAKEKELAEKEAEAAKNKPLDAADLSKK